MITELERNHKFVVCVGSIRKADRMQQIWSMSYAGFGKTKNENFSNHAKSEGYTDRQIKMFYNL